MAIKFKTDYRFAHNGLRVEPFKAGQVVENPSEDLLKTATADGVLCGVEKEFKAEPETKPEPKKTKVKA